MVPARTPADRLREPVLFDGSWTERWDSFVYSMGVGDDAPVLRGIIITTDVIGTDTQDAAPAAEPSVRHRVPGALRAARALVTLPRIAVALVAALAGLAYGWSMNSQTLEMFYAAGVRSMAGSWHDFFYDAFDPRGSMTLDKLPGAFWVQVLSVKLFGYSVWAMVLPQVVEGVLTVLALYRAVRRVAGTAAGLIAAVLLAVSPVVFTSTRGDLSEPLYLLCLVLAADAVLRYAVRSGSEGDSRRARRRRRRAAIAAAVWVAVAFQAKMTEAWLALPALLAALVLGSAAARRRSLALAGAVAGLAVALSLTWVCAFALTPAADRPVVDGSAHNSIFEQVFEYNAGFRVSGGNNTAFGMEPLAAPDPEAVRNLALDSEPANAEYAYSGAAWTTPGFPRLLYGAVAPDAAWLIPAAVLGAGAVLTARRRARRGDPQRAAALLWGLWLLGYGAVFSGATVIHDYYLATLAPALAALTAMGLVTMWRGARRGSRKARAALAATAAVQGAWSALVLPGSQPLWLGPVAAGCGLATATLLWFRFRPRAAATDLDGASMSFAGSESDDVSEVGGTGHPDLTPEPVAATTAPSSARRRASVVAAALLTAVTAAVAVLAGQVDADVWSFQHAAGPFDTPFGPGGTLARPSAENVLVRAQLPLGYGGTVLRATPVAWAKLASSGRRLRQQQTVEKLDHLPAGVLVFSSAEASNYLVSAVAQVYPVGGFTGDVPSPSAQQVRDLIERHRIAFAVVPSEGETGGNDPRVQVVVDECILASGAPLHGAQVYVCGDS